MSTKPVDWFALLGIHPWDELIFGGFICTTCTPDDADDADDNVHWPCPVLVDAGMTNGHAEAIIRAQRAEYELRHVREKALAEINRLGSELADANTMIGSLGSQLAKAETARDKAQADLAAAQEHHRKTVTGVWDDTVPPGGYVCGYCGNPVESEPCTDHEPSTVEPDRMLTAVERWQTEAGFDPAGMTDHGAGAS